MLALLPIHVKTCTSLRPSFFIAPEQKQRNCFSYISLVHEVLNSVSKTEESLRRLKSRTLNANDDGSAAQAAADVTSDEAKIREQIRLDVLHFVGRVSTRAFDTDR